MDTMGEQFCLKWNNHQSTLISIFDTLLDSGNHVDCCLAAEGKSLNAHKVILSACSPYLEYLLNQHQDKYPVLVFSDLKFHELKAMLEYMYRGEVNVVQEQLNGFLKAAEALQIKGLTDQGGGGGGGGGGGDTDIGGGGGGGSNSGGMSNKRKPRDDHQELASADCGSMSPSTGGGGGGGGKRRRQRRTSQDQQSSVPPIDNHPDTSSNSCDILPQASASSVVTKPPKIETDRLSTTSTSSNQQQQPPPPPPQSAIMIKEKIEPPDLIQPKAEYLEDPNDDHIEDLTLDDDDDDDSYLAKPGSSHAPDSQGYDTSWQYNADTSNPPDLFLGSQDPSGNQNNSQAGVAYQYEDIIPMLLESMVTGEETVVPFTLSFDESTKVRTYSCSHCEYKNYDLGKIKRHYNDKHNPNPKTHNCPYCPYKAKRKSNLMYHQVSKHDVDSPVHFSNVSM